MIQFRPFLNTDPPAIVDIWRQQPPLRASVESINRDSFDKFVFSKPYFDRNGFIVAERQSEILGFVHAGFGPNHDQSDINKENGILAQLKVKVGKKHDEIAQQLIAHGIKYLKTNGAKSCYAGSQFPHAPFYMGLYGGSRIPGVLEKDKLFLEAFLRAGFVRMSEFAVMTLAVPDFKPLMGREIMTAKRKFLIAPSIDPRERTWWECCSLGMADRDAFTISTRRTQELVARAVFWDMMPLAGEWGVQARGVYDLRIMPDFQHEKLELFLLSESLKHLKEQGIGLVEAQTRVSNTPALETFQRLGFVETGRGVQLVMDISDRP